MASTSFCRRAHLSSFLQSMTHASVRSQLSRRNMFAHRRRALAAACLITAVILWKLPHSVTVTTRPISERIHIVLTASGAYTLGLTALINSTMSNASPNTKSRLHFHLVSPTRNEAQQVVTTLVHHFGRSVRDAISLYDLDELQDHRLSDAKVWADYRAASLSQVSFFISTTAQCH